MASTHFPIHSIIRRKRYKKKSDMQASVIQANLNKSLPVGLISCSGLPVLDLPVYYQERASLNLLILSPFPGFKKCFCPFLIV